MTTKYDAEGDWHQFLLEAIRIARYGTLAEIELYITKLSVFPFNLLDSTSTKDSKEMIFAELVRLLKIKRTEMMLEENPKNTNLTWTGKNITLQHPEGPKLGMFVEGFQGQIYNGVEQWVLMGTINRPSDITIVEKIKEPDVYDPDPKRELMI